MPAVLRAVFLALPLFLLAGPAPAGTVFYYFSGTTAGLVDEFGLPVVDADATTFRGWVGWDPETPASSGTGVIRANIAAPIAPNGLSITVDRFGQTFVADPGAVLMQSVVSDAQGGGGFSVQSLNVDPFPFLARFTEDIDISLGSSSGTFDYPNPTIPTSLDLADFQFPTVFFRFIDFDTVTMVVTSFQYSGTITSLDPVFFFDSLAACGAIPGEGVELCGDVTAGGAFFGQQVLDSEIDTTAAAVLANLQAGDTAQIWDLSLDGVLTGDGQLTFAYNPELLGAADESDIRIARYDAALEQWVALPTLSLDTGVDTITVEITGFSLFAVTLPEPIGKLLGELQSPVPTSLGDILFTADGATAWVIGDSEGSSSTISTVPVLRDGSNRVEGFGSPVMRLSRSTIDTGLEFAPGTDVVFYTYASADSELSIGQRRADGMTREEVISTASANGGMVFIPSGPHAGNLLVSEYDTGLIKRFDVSPDGNGFFDLVEIATVGDLGLAGSLGDIEFVPSGPFAGQLLVANYSNSRVELYDIDLMTLAISPESTLFFAQAAGPWGLEFDPLTDELFVADYDASAGETAIWRVPEPGAGAAGLAALGALWLLHRRRRPC